MSFCHFLHIIIIANIIQWIQTLISVFVFSGDFYYPSKENEEGCILSPCLFNLYAE